MKKTTNIILALLATIYYGCDDVFEEDIENDLVQIISPNEGDVIQGNTIEFSWQPLDGADDYRIKVVNENLLTVVDSLVSDTNINFTVSSGEYQWRIKGENFAYSTQYTFPINFSVVDSEDLTNQNVILLTPSADFYTNSNSIILTWSPIATAESYTLEIAKINSGQQTTILQEMAITNTNFNAPTNIFDEDAEYTWKIKAVNSTSETAFSERMIFIDTSVPSQASLVAPANLSVVTDTTIDFNWLLGSDTGVVQSARKSVIEVSTDINFGTLIFSEDIETNSYQYTFNDIGLYYWRVLIYDIAGNTGDYSAVSSFTIE